MNNIQIQITDPITSPPHKGKLNSFFVSLINDSRNLPFIHLILIVLFTTIPFAVFLFMPGVFRWWIAVVYFLFNSIFLMGPVILMQHNVAHKPLFKKKFKKLNNLVPWVIGPFFGLTPESYFAHHIGMHHPENNLDDDLSSTMGYRRDSVKDFSRYFFHFFFFGIYDLMKYLVKNRRKKLMRNMLAGEVLFFLLIVLLLFVNVKATIIVFVFPVFFTRFMMMAGNWAQHAFIDLEQPANCYRNSITCINSRYNRTCWNDGYHIGHHFFPSLHWTEMPGEFVAHINQYSEEDAVVFQKLDYFMIWFFLMSKNYKMLSTYFVELHPSHPRTQEEIIALLKSRTRGVVKSSGSYTVSVH